MLRLSRENLMASISSSKTLVDFIEHSFKRFPHKTALIVDNQRFDYQTIKSITDNISSQLIKITKKSQIVALLLPNSPEFIFAYFSILKANCVVLLLPANISDQSLIYQIEKTNTKIIITNNIYQEKIKRAGLVNKLEMLTMDYLLSRTVKLIKRPPTARNISTIIFTSGTTSLPKGVILLHKNVVNATKNICQFLKLRHSDIDINISSLSHSFGLGHIHCLFAVGGTVVLFRDAINLKKILLAIHDYKATTFGAVPAVLRLLINNYPQQLKKYLKNLRFIQTNTSPLEKNLITTITTLLPHCDFNYYYGLSEASRSTFITLNKHKSKWQSSGQPSPHVKVKIADPHTQRTLPAGKIGEICIKGKHVIQTYWKNPKATRTIKNGWLYTGDVGYMDKEHFLYFKGRKDDVINVAGEKVMPEEIEEVTKQYPAIQDCAAIGVPDRLLGEKVKLYIQLKNSKAIQNEALLRFLRLKLESYKLPRAIETIEKIPRTDNGKLMRNKLKNAYG